MICSGCGEIIRDNTIICPCCGKRYNLLKEGITEKSIKALSYSDKIEVEKIQREIRIYEVQASYGSKEAQRKLLELKSKLAKYGIIEKDAKEESNNTQRMTDLMREVTRNFESNNSNDKLKTEIKPTTSRKQLSYSEKIEVEKLQREISSYEVQASYGSKEAQKRLVELKSNLATYGIVENDKNKQANNNESMADLMKRVNEEFERNNISNNKNKKIIPAMCVNVMLLGRTGAGKSTFINYLFGSELAPTAVGKPCTQGIDEYQCVVGKLLLKVYDSKGLEVEQLENIKSKLISNIIAKNSSSNIEDWIHSIFYVININRSRLEDEELQFIKDINKQISQTVNVILTHCSNNDEGIKNQEEMKSTIYKYVGEDINVFCVNSKATNTRVHKENSFGKNEILENMPNILWKDICYKAKEEFCKQAKKINKKYIDRWYEQARYLAGCHVSDSIFTKFNCEKKYPAFETGMQDLNLTIRKGIAGEMRQTLHFVMEPYIKFYTLFVQLLPMEGAHISNYSDGLNLNLPDLYGNIEYGFCEELFLDILTGIAYVFAPVLCLIFGDTDYEATMKQINLAYGRLQHHLEINDVTANKIYKKLLALKSDDNKVIVVYKN